MALVPHVSAEVSQLSTGLHRHLDLALLRLDAGHVEPAIGSSGTSIPMVLIRVDGCRSPALLNFLHGLPCRRSDGHVVPLSLCSADYNAHSI